MLVITLKVLEMRMIKYSFTLITPYYLVSGNGVLHYSSRKAISFADFIYSHAIETYVDIETFLMISALSFSVPITTFIY